ncbi:hypothetical protein RRG08_014113 [Elysia crispata]|uniref:Ionotropic glutamate receptor C-terminal domain-containing protein n=1 Tax=Elysia crispata TaxID=231223 RepID=A0AAE0ZY13_9GAST|nr:hypothetical protein RRG08_014113 [Elysia crispata]
MTILEYIYALNLAFWIILVITSDALGRSHSIARSENEDDFASRIKLSSFKTAQDVTPGDIALKPLEIVKWTNLLAWTREVLSFMMYQGNQYGVEHNLFHRNQNSFILIYTNEMAYVVAEMEKSFSCRGALPKVAAWRLNASSRRQDVLKVLSTSLGMETEVRSVIVASSHVDFVYLVLDVVATDQMFKWRRFLHAIEWLALTIDRPPVSSIIPSHKSLPDFLTFLSIKQFGIDVSQKSRTQPLETVLQVPLDLSLSSCQRIDWSQWSSSLNLTKPALRSVKDTLLSPNLRRDATIYLSSQKSVMAGMRIPTVIVTSGPGQTALLDHDGNETFLSSFNMVVLNLLSETLGFTAEPFPVTDGGFYGSFKSNEEVLGVSGYLKRREAGLSPMAMVGSAIRRKVIDFLNPHIKEEFFYIMYRVHFDQSQLGDLRSGLIKTGTDLMYCLIGPCIAVLVGLLIFLVSGVFTNKGKIYGRANLRRLYDFPFHWLFQTTESLPHQSGRILRASWGLFCVAMFTSYGALLTSNAAAPQEYPKITSLEDLLRQPDFKIGVPFSNSFFITSLKEAEAGTTLADLWKVLVAQNQSDPETFTTDQAHHIRRVLEGQYAYLSSLPLGLLSSYSNADFSNVRFAIQWKLLLRMCVPQNAFYKPDLDRALQSATEMGILKYIQDKWVPSETQLNRFRVERQPEIHLSSLKVLMYSVTAGIGVASLSLAVENLVHLCLSYGREVSHQLIRHDV